MKKFLAFALILVLASCGSNPTPSQPSTTVTLEQTQSMTPEQIEALDADKLAELEQQADAAFAEATKDLNLAPEGLTAQALCSVAGPVWPNAARTKCIALSINYNQYNSLRFTFSGPNWSSDGCSNVPDYVFLRPCQHHDFAYRNLPKYKQFRTDSYRAQADSRFYSDMISRCNERYSWYDPRRAACKVVAYTYWSGVRTLGRASYYGTTQLYP